MHLVMGLWNTKKSVSSILHLIAESQEGDVWRNTFCCPNLYSFRLNDDRVRDYRTLNFSYHNIYKCMYIYIYIYIYIYKYEKCTGKYTVFHYNFDLRNENYIQRILYGLNIYVYINTFVKINICNYFMRPISKLYSCPLNSYFKRYCITVCVHLSWHSVTWYDLHQVIRGGLSTDQ